VAGGTIANVGLQLDKTVVEKVPKAQLESARKKSQREGGFNRQRLRNGGKIRVLCQKTRRSGLGERGDKKCAAGISKKGGGGEMVRLAARSNWENRKIEKLWRGKTWGSA